MARSRALSYTPEAASTNQHAPESSTSLPGNTRSAGLRAIEQLRRRLDTIDEHIRELCSARHILFRREQLLIQERDELVKSLRSIEAALMERLSYFIDISQSPTTPGEPVEDPKESDVPYKRQAVSDPSDRPTARKRSFSSKDEETTANRDVSKCAPLSALGTESTLIAECPPELSQPSKSLPRPASGSPPGSFVNSPARPQSASITRNGIRYPPGSVPRPSRARSASPLTQMLPPSISSSPVTPVASKGYYPMIRGLSPAELGSPIDILRATGSTTAHSVVATCDGPALAPAKLGTEADRPYVNPLQLSRLQRGTMPIDCVLNDPSFNWNPTHLERALSPPIGAPHSSWLARPDARSKYNEYEDFTKSEAQSAKNANKKVAYDQNGPASRTRARLNGTRATSKGKGRASV
ncbi:hypothetical protein RSOLAG22IIIB_03593 [Rhizoctonia solani]|uniref:Uncharacterized protein n=1 Tax=Rhizoctonia solani TaxID=456999 RepID=A0A0K6FRE5_9AGAM|nr:hypothetical protein RSOLAG22IIIB_03593 [Rhizoctonia solani]